MAANKKYLEIISHYESCLARHGDTHLGVDWPKKIDAETRYRIMLELIRLEDRSRELHLLDFGCGASHLFDYICERKIERIRYSGLDLSEKFLELSRNKFPKNEYFCIDLTDESATLPNFDYIVMNGVFTEKRGISFDDMYMYFQQLLRNTFGHAKIGLAFNVMSKHVDWERDDLFHLPFDMLADFVTRELSRNFVFRNDYGLYEYTTYVYR